MNDAVQFIRSENGLRLSCALLGDWRCSVPTALGASRFTLEVAIDNNEYRSAFKPADDTRAPGGLQIRPSINLRRGRAIADLPSTRSCHQGERLTSVTATLGAALEALA